MPPHQNEIARIRTASRRLVRAFGFLDKTLAGTDMSASAVHALVEIGPTGSITARHLAETLGLEKSTISRLVAGLIARGELTEHPSSADRREKLLTLTPKGRKTLASIDRFAENQIVTAIGGLPACKVRSVVEGLETYADALAPGGAGTENAEGIRISDGYAPGLIAAVVGMHMDFYSRETGFGQAFETRVAGGLAEFIPRVGHGRSNIWHVSDGGRIVGSIAIDGEDLGHDHAHLRWFIVDDSTRGTGLGRKLLTSALDFCDAQGFAETHLWTFRGLDAARVLYERHGFELVEEWPGDQWGKQVMEQKFIRHRP